jgi:hypothetical protein
MTFTPTSDLERHQKYFDAFLISRDPHRSLGEFFDSITKYIFDPNIHHTDEEDLQFLKDLLFESAFGKLHIAYYEWVVAKMVPFAFPQSLRVLSRYVDFLCAISVMFLDDFFHFLCKNPNKEIIRGLFPILSAENRVNFIRVVNNYPDVVKLIPKVKLYITFT